MLQEESLEIKEAMKVTRYRQLNEAFQKFTIDEETNLNELVRVVLENTVKAMDAVAGTLWYYDRHGDGNIHIKAVYGGGEMTGITLRPGEGVAGKVIESGTSAMIADCQKDSRWAGKVDRNTGFRTESMICVPIFVEEDIFGCIQIINKVDRDIFDKKDLKFADSLAQYVSGMLSSCPNELLKQYNFFHSDWDEKTTFANVFHNDNGMKMRAVLRSMEEIQKLSAVQRESVFYHAEKIRKILNGRRKES